MIDDKLNLCLGSEGELWQSDLSWEWRVRVRRNRAPQGTRHWQIHPARRISEAFCFESWLLTSDPHPSSCQPLKDASPCQGSSAPLILVIHSPDRPGPTLSTHIWKSEAVLFFFFPAEGRILEVVTLFFSFFFSPVALLLQVTRWPQNVHWAGGAGGGQQPAWERPPPAQIAQPPHPDAQ